MKRFFNSPVVGVLCHLDETNSAVSSIPSTITSLYKACWPLTLKNRVILFSNKSECHLGYFNGFLGSVILYEILINRHSTLGFPY